MDYNLTSYQPTEQDYIEAHQMGALASAADYIEENGIQLFLYEVSRLIRSPRDEHLVNQLHAVLSTFEQEMHQPLPPSDLLVSRTIIDKAKVFAECGAPANVIFNYLDGELS